MNIQDKKNLLSLLLGDLKNDAELSEEEIASYRAQLGGLNEEVTNRLFDRFIVRKETGVYVSPAVYLYRVLDHM